MKRIISILVILAILITGGVLVSKGLRANGDKAQTQYRVALVKSDTVKKTVTATGVLKPWTFVDIKSKAGGRIDTFGPDIQSPDFKTKPGLKVDEGSMVKAGQVIAEIDPSDTMLTFNTAKADIESNTAKVHESDISLKWQKAQTEVAIHSAQASVASAKASSASTRARMESAIQQAANQEALTDASIDSAKDTLDAEKARLAQMTSATHPQELALAKAQLNQARANLKNAELQLNRQKALLDKGFTSQSTVEQAQANYDVAFATQESAFEKTRTIGQQQESDLSAQKSRVRQLEAVLRTAEANRVDVQVRKQSAESAKADFQQSLAAIHTAEASLQKAMAEPLNNAMSEYRIAQAKAAGARATASMVNAKIQLDQTHVVATTNGIILKKYVEEGTLISSGISFNSSGTSIVQLGTTDRMYIDVQVDETDVASVDVDQKVEIAFDAYPSTPFEGKVIKVDPQAVIESNVTTIHVRVEVDNSAATYRLLKPGMNATCEFIVNKKENVIAVPNEALKTDNDGKRYVEIATGGKVAPADKDGEPDPNLLVAITLKKSPVEIALEGNDLTEITSGVKEGEKIITQTIEPAPPASASGNPFGGSKGPGRR